MAKTFGLGIIGAGVALKPHALALTDLAERVEVTGLYSRDPDRRAAAAAEYGYPPAPSLEALLADEGTDAVLILTPPNARREIVAAAAAAGKHILMEKPIERDVAAATEIVEICEAANVRLGIVFQHRFREGARVLRNHLQGGGLGTIAAAWLTVPWWRPQSYYDEPGRGSLAQDGGGVLITQAIHSLDLLLSLTGPVAEVQAIAKTTGLHRMETEDFVGAGMIFANGAPGGLIATTAAAPGFEEELVLCCSNGTARLKGGLLSLDWNDGPSETVGTAGTTGGGADRMAFPHAWHRNLIDQFFDALERGEDPQSNGRTALLVHYLIEALLTSARDGARTNVQQPQKP